MAESGSALDDRALRPAVATDETIESHFIRSLPVLVLHAHSSCNCRCIMCDIWKTPEKKAFGVDDLKPHLSSIQRLGVRWVVFSGGEPLLNPQLFSLCSLLHQEGIRLTLLTTGVLLRKFAAQVVTNFDDVIVSLDGPREVHDAIRRVPGAFALVQSGVAALRERRANLPITARTTVQKANHGQLRKTVHAAQEIDLDGISFLAVDLTSSAFNRPLLWPVGRQENIGLSLVEVGELEAEIEALVAEIPCGTPGGFVTETPEKLRRIARQFRVQLGLQPGESPVCNAPWMSAVIEVDGSVRPCFFHPSVGNLQEQTLESILNGPEARTFRENLAIPDNPICRRCVCSLHYRL